MWASLFGRFFSKKKRQQEKQRYIEENEEGSSTNLAVDSNPTKKRAKTNSATPTSTDKLQKKSRVASPITPKNTQKKKNGSSNQGSTRSQSSVPVSAQTQTQTRTIMLNTGMNASTAIEVVDLATDPLQGAKVYILPVHDDLDTNTTNHESYTAMQRELGSFVSSLGGSVATSLEDATHAVWPPPLKIEAAATFLSVHLQTLWVQAQEQQVPIVEADSWLECVADLSPQEHWSDIDVSRHMPAIFRSFMNQQPPQSVASNSSRSNNNTAQRASPQNQSKKKTSKRRSGRRRDREEQKQMNQSIHQTFTFLSQHNPQKLEEDALQRAMELSLLDCALVIRRQSSFARQHSFATGGGSVSSTGLDKLPQEILGLKIKSQLPTVAQCKVAYRKLARVHHPDKGGSAETFFQIAKAYRTLLADIAEHAETLNNASNARWTDPSEQQLSLKSTAHWDSELQDHRRLVEELFTSHGTNLAETLEVQGSILQSILKLQPYDAGSTNHNEEEELIHNSCFYLSLAASYLNGIGALSAGGVSGDTLGEMKKHSTEANEADETAIPKFDDEDLYLIRATALQLKRLIEAAVVRAHPEWAASGKVGEEVQAFSDFLVYLLDSPDSLLSDWAVVVFDTVSGVCDVYQGKFFADQSADWQSTNTITIQYLPGHYQPLLPMASGMSSIDETASSTSSALQRRPKLADILKVLDKQGAYYVVTDGAG